MHSIHADNDSHSPEAVAVACAAGAVVEATAAEPQGSALVSYEVCFAENSKSRRQVRWERRKVAQDMARKSLRRGSKYPREVWCGHKMKDRRLVDVRLNKEKGHANYSGIQYCGNVWLCPVCSSFIRSARARDIERGVSEWRRRSNGLYMLTVTLRHHKCDELNESLGCLERSWRRLVGRKAWRELKDESNLVGYVRSLELTYGQNGWHPHFHFLLFVEGDATENGAEAIRQRLLESWKDVVQACGGELPNDHGIDVQAVGDGEHDIAAQYVSKELDGDNIALEIARSDLKSKGNLSVKEVVECGKGSLTPFELLDFDDDFARMLWDEYKRAVKNKRSVFFTKGLRKLLGLAESKTDEELVEELEAQGEVCVAVLDSAYENMLARDCGLAVKVLECVERGDIGRAAELIGCRAVRGSDLPIDEWDRAELAEKYVLVPDGFGYGEG